MMTFDAQVALALAAYRTDDEARACGCDACRLALIAGGGLRRVVRINRDLSHCAAWKRAR